MTSSISFPINNKLTIKSTSIKSQVIYEDKTMLTGEDNLLMNY